MNYLIKFFFKLQSIKWRLLAIFITVIGLIAIFYFYYPKSVVTLGVSVGDLENGQPKANSGYEKLQKHLAQNGVELRFKTQLDLATQKPNLEFLINDPEVDFVYARNTGAPMPDSVVEQFSSLGSIYKSAVWFYVKSGKSDIKKLKDLKGKKIIFWSTPEGNEKPVFSSKDAKASIYSSDYVLETIFNKAGITPENTQIKNIYPDKVKFSQDWDVWVAFSLPSKTSNTSDLWNEYIDGRIQLLQLEDLEGVSRGLSYVKFGRLPASAHLTNLGLPKQDTSYLAYTTNVIVRNDLDPSIVMLISEFLKKNNSAQSLINDKDEYPNFSQTGSFKPNKTAEDFYAHGRPFLSQHLSPGLSAFILKILLILVPALTILWPITHFVPAVYHFYVKHKITHWYSDLEFIERNYLKADEDTRIMMKNQIQEIEMALQEMKFPIMHLHYVQELFIAKEHVELIRKRYNI
ncbi:MAG: hypothetical protein RLZZ410_513 [Pseudomonadota bacterium]|jgi:hypothetical protein